ncbi:hypothetical protein V8C43DRAFT_270161 [Trichoderma afarasin]
MQTSTSMQYRTSDERDKKALNTAHLEINRCVNSIALGLGIIWDKCPPDGDGNAGMLLDTG